MRDIYKNNQEIYKFFNKAQVKIAELSAILANEQEDESNKSLLLGLSDFIESIDSPYCTFSISDTLRYVHYWNRRAKLKSIPFIQITDYIVNINTGAGGVDITDLESLIRDILKRTPHNILGNIQGGSITERYHLTKEEQEWVKCQMRKTPCPDKIPSTVSLILATSRNPYPSGYYELGSKIESVSARGRIAYNYYKQASSFTYMKEDVILGSIINNPEILAQPNPVTDGTGINKNTMYSFSAVFPDGIKTASGNILFKQPMYFGSVRRTNSSDIANIIATGTKDVRDRGTMSLEFTIPTGNTLLDYNQARYPYILVPLEWGVFTSAINATFDFGKDWTATQVDMPLLDGTTRKALLIIYNTQIEGVSTFNFIW